jgi:hypothetical protein
MNQPHFLARVYQLFATISAVVKFAATASMCLGFLWCAQFILDIGGYFYSPKDGWLTTTNIFAAVFFGVAIYMAIGGIAGVFNALPAITPRHISETPGRSRFASRDDLRRGGLI